MSKQLILEKKCNGPCGQTKPTSNFSKKPNGQYKSQCDLCIIDATKSKVSRRSGYVTKIIHIDDFLYFVFMYCSNKQLRK